MVAHSIAGSTKHGRSDTENSRQGYLRSNDCRERKDKNRDREGNELKDKLQGTGKLQLLLKEREKSEELPVGLHRDHTYHTIPLATIVEQNPVYEHIFIVSNDSIIIRLSYP